MFLLDMIEEGVPYEVFMAMLHTTDGAIFSHESMFIQAGFCSLRVSNVDLDFVVRGDRIFAWWK